MNDWRASGACKDQPTWLFFPTGVEGGGFDKQQQAMAICAACPVLLDCRSWALAHEIHGVWGGTTERERTKLRRRTGIKVNEPAPDDDSWKQTRAAYLFHQGWTANQIAIELRANIRQVHRWLDAEGLDAYPSPDGRAPRRRHKATPRKRLRKPA